MTQEQATFYQEILIDLPGKIWHLESIKKSLFSGGA
jgi:hypothetical protein